MLLDDEQMRGHTQKEVYGWILGHIATLQRGYEAYTGKTFNPNVGKLRIVPEE